LTAGRHAGRTRPGRVGARSELRALLAAASFLSVIPVGRRLVFDADDLARSGPAFPLVGAAIGAAVGATAAALAHPLSPLLAAALALALGVALTGALHLDGLADSADALAARSRADALRIMRDHAIGAYGASALGLDLLIKLAALSELVAHHRAFGAAIAAGALSRLTPVLLGASLPYARPEGGTGSALAAGGRLRAGAAAAVALVVALLAAHAGGGVLFATALALALLLAGLMRRWLGGVTGDTLGAALELTELTVLVAAVAIGASA
jgi:adenosylcobinamide-GDP ribazoletransferase